MPGVSPLDDFFNGIPLDTSDWRLGPFACSRLSSMESNHITCLHAHVLRNLELELPALTPMLHEKDATSNGQTVAAGSNLAYKRGEMLLGKPLWLMDRLHERYFSNRRKS